MGRLIGGRACDASLQRSAYPVTYTRANCTITGSNQSAVDGPSSGALPRPAESGCIDLGLALSLAHRLAATDHLSARQQGHVLSMLVEAPPKMSDEMTERERSFLTTF